MMMDTKYVSRLENMWAHIAAKNPKMNQLFLKNSEKKFFTIVFAEIEARVAFIEKVYNIL